MTPPSNSSSSRSCGLAWRMVAKEQADLDELVGDLAVKEGQLLAELQRERGEAVRITRETWSSLSRGTAVVWFMAKEKVTKWKEKKENGEGGSGSVLGVA